MATLSDPMNFQKTMRYRLSAHAHAFHFNRETFTQKKQWHFKKNIILSTAELFSSIHLFIRQAINTAIKFVRMFT